VDNERLFPGDNLSSSPREEKTEKRKPRLRKVNRSQMVLHPVEIERLIPDDHEARVIWELTGSLDPVLLLRQGRCERWDSRVHLPLIPVFWQASGSTHIPRE